MSAREPVQTAPRSYLEDGNTLWAWLTTHDHKRIAILYAIAITVFFVLGGLAAGLVRLELTTPAGDLLTAEGYNKTFTFHGVIMVWFFLIPSIPATLGNFLLPLMIGARDVAFPRLNLFSWYLYMAGALFTRCLPAVGWGGYRLDVLHAVLHDVFQFKCHSGGRRGVYCGFLLNLHRHQLHRDDPHDAYAVA